MLMILKISIFLKTTKKMIKINNKRIYLKQLIKMHLMILINNSLLTTIIDIIAGFQDFVYFEQYLKLL